MEWDGLVGQVILPAILPADTLSSASKPPGKPARSQDWVVGYFEIQSRERAPSDGAHGRDERLQDLRAK